MKFSRRLLPASLIICSFALTGLFTSRGEASCIGFSDMCAYVGQRGPTACKRQRNCSWDRNFNTCQGFDLECHEISDQCLCENQSGCNWSNDQN